MADPTFARNNIVRYEGESVKRFPVAAGVKLLRGYLMQITSGGTGEVDYAIDTGVVPGFSIENVDNTGGSAGAKFINVATDGEIILQGDATLANADGQGVGDLAYPNAAATVDGLEVDSAGTNPAGRVSAFENTNDQHGLTNAVCVVVGPKAL